MSSTGSTDGGWEEIMGKDLILKRIKNGLGNTAEMGTVVRCNLRGYFVDGSGVKVEPFETLLSQQYKVGEGDAVPGIEMAVRFSRVGDILRVRFKAKFGYGEKGRPPVTTVEGKDNNSADGAATDKLVTSAIPPDTDLEYEIEVLSHLAEGQIDPIVLANHPHISSVEGNDESSHESYERHMERLLALTELLQRKEAGNRWFSYGDYSRALRAYSKATQVADRYFNGAANSGGDSNAKALQGLAVTKNMQGANAEEQAASLAEANAALAAAEREKEAQRKPVEKRDEELVSGYLSCLNNMAAAQLRQGEPGKAKEVCVRVLEVDPGNQKALLRAAKAALATHDYEECELCLTRLLTVAPAGSAAAQAALAERRRLRQAQQEYRAQNKKMSENMARQLFKPAPKGASPTSSTSTHTDNGAAPSLDADGAGFVSAAVHGEPPAPQAAAAGAGGENVVDGGKKSTSAAGGAATETLAAPASSGADTGLLLLLATSLLVLVVSVAMVWWSRAPPSAH